MPAHFVAKYEIFFTEYTLKIKVDYKIDLKFCGSYLKKKKFLSSQLLGVLSYSDLIQQHIDFTIF